MSDAEALMWQVEADPWLNPSGGVAVLLDRPADPERFRSAIAAAVAALPRLFERVVTTPGRLANPRFVPDAEFDLDWHIRRMALPAPGSDRQLLDLAARWLEDPYDRTRPLWQFLLVEGLAEGRGAVLWKLHHTLMDGKTAVRLTEMFTDFDRAGAERQAVDLAAIVAAASAEASSAPDPSDDESASSLRARVVSATSGPIGALRTLAAEAMLTGSDPERVNDLGSQVSGAVRQIREVLSAPEPAGSSLWTNRSRRRRAEAISLPLDAVKAAAARLEGTVNDVFVAGLVEGVAAFHRKRSSDLSSLRVSFIVSTRTKESGANAFAPSIASIPVSGVTGDERFSILRNRLRSGRTAVATGGGLMDRAASLARLLPTSTITELGRRQSAGIDFATSNLRGAPVPVYVAGAMMLRNTTLGPVAGTAFNATALSMASTLDIGLHLDSVAIDDPEGLVSCIQAAFDDLLATPAPTRPKPPAQRRPASSASSRTSTAPRAPKHPR